MKSLRFLGTLLLTAVLAPVSLAGQSAQERLDAALGEAVERGIPTSLLQSKIDEGTAKGVAMDRIADAVEHRLDGLAQAQEALAGVPDADDTDLSVGADAIGSGVSEAVLAEVASDAPREHRAVAIAALTYLVNAQIAPDQAVTAVQDAIARGPEALQNLPADLDLPGSLEIPVGQAGPPAGVPAPGDGPVDGRVDGAGPPDDLPDRPPIG